MHIVGFINYWLKEKSISLQFPTKTPSAVQACCLFFVKSLISPLLRLPSKSLLASIRFMPWSHTWALGSWYILQAMSHSRWKCFTLKQGHTKIMAVSRPEDRDKDTQGTRCERACSYPRERERKSVQTFMVDKRHKAKITQLSLPVLSYGKTSSVALFVCIFVYRARGTVSWREGPDIQEFFLNLPTPCVSLKPLARNTHTETYRTALLNPSGLIHMGRAVHCLT